MVCIYCGGDTSVSNSRSQTKTNQVWRRRHCLDCDGLFTSIEVADLASSILYKKDKRHVEPFERDKLFISIYESCKHRKDAPRAATALTTTVLSKLLAQIETASLSREKVIDVSSIVLKHFDKAAATQYLAYHPPHKS